VGKVTDSSLDSDRIEILDKVRKFAEAKLQLSAFNPGESNVPVSGKVLDPEDFVAVVDSSLDGWLT
jgi:CDP-6-deoxy-D-xylo-4-hexulose-3-dehydrase